MEPGTQLGHYTIVSALGKGGMGEVWRGRDTKLGREVAVKTLPAEFAKDADRLARFEREAKLLASLNHSNIAAIYGLEESSGIRFLVLELVEGETLADQLKRGAVSVEESLKLALQISEALEAAHDKGVIHRDLKPANIKVTPDGKIKVLDFGLAKAFAGDQADVSLSNSPTLSMAATQQGIVLGTAAYMSPEQVRGEPVDKRADIWAFGCVLYEMLTGRATFDGTSVSDLLAAVLKTEPEWSRLPTEIHPRIHFLLERCLEKEEKNRYHDIADARVDLQRVLADPHAGGLTQKGPNNGQSPARAWLPWLALVILSAGVGGTAVWSSRPTGPSGADPSGPIARMTVNLPADHELAIDAQSASLALSPDGSLIVYAARSEGRTQLYLRDVADFEARLLPGSDGAEYPFFSPDGQWVAFFASGQLQRVSVSGGAPVSIGPAPTVGRGGTWGMNDTIIFSSGDSGLLRVSAGGGIPEPLATEDSQLDAARHVWPRFLPGRDALISTVDGRLLLLTLETGQWRDLGPGAQGQYLPSGHLIYHAGEGEVHAVPFDIGELAATGLPVSVVSDVFRAADGGAAYFAVSENGTFIFTGYSFERQLVRVDRSGVRTPLAGERLGYRFPRVSPDGQWLAVTIDPRPSEVWVYGIERPTRVALAADGRHSLAPVWTPDSQRVTYTADNDIEWRIADASSTAEVLLERPRPQYAKSWSSDQTQLTFDEQHSVTEYDVWLLTRGDEPQPLLADPGNQVTGMISPNGHWLAYESDESGRVEVYVRPFPEVGRLRIQISTQGGNSPVWSRDGAELFYMNGTALMAVRVQDTGERIVPDSPLVLFDGPFDPSQNLNYDVFPDGRSFAMVETDADATPNRIQVVLNWHQELLERVPID